MSTERSAEDLLRGIRISLNDLLTSKDEEAIRLVETSAAELQEHCDRIALPARRLHFKIKEIHPVTDKFARCLSDFSALISLDLERNSLNNRDVDTLTAMHWPNLQWLSLAYNDIDEEGVEILAQRWRTSMPQLSYVDFTSNPCNPVDELWYNEGSVARPREFALKLEANYEAIPWLHIDIKDGQVNVVNRFELVTVEEREPEPAGVSYYGATSKGTTLQPVQVEHWRTVG